MISINLAAQIRNTEWSTFNEEITGVVWCVVALLSLMLAAQAKDKMGGGTEQAIAALEQKWADAGKASNPDVIAPLLADKFINTDSSGKVTGKAETLASTKASKWEKDEISNVKVTVFGKTAIASGDWGRQRDRRKWETSRCPRALD